jgi:tRNA threonylcarbamoyladenosine biosynthesis protein TsaE
LIPGAFSLYRILSSGPEETRTAGEWIGAALKEGSVVALRGKLGAGKTCLAGGIARALGVEEAVTSPSYTIVSEYPGRLPLYHIDAYRLGGDDDFAALGGEEYLCGGGVSVVEWSEKIPGSLPEDAIFIDINIRDDGKREILLEGPPGFRLPDTGGGE